MLPLYTSKALLKIHKTYKRHLRSSIHPVIELNDDYIDNKKKALTRLDLIKRLVSMEQAPNSTIQNMYYYLKDVGNVKDSGYVGFGKLLGYKDLDAAGLRRIGFSVLNSH